MPAQSPTLSPTLSAITAGLRGSSSGIPASILPTRSAPTSAPLVKMPPPRRAKIEISEAPKLERHQGLDDAARLEAEMLQDEVVDGDAQQPEPDHQHAGHRPGFEGDVQRRRQALAGGLGGADIGAHGDVHADIAGGAAQHRADDEADGDIHPQSEGEDHGDDDPHDGDGRILPVEIGAGAFLNCRGDLRASDRCRSRRRVPFGR